MAADAGRYEAGGYRDRTSSFPRFPRRQLTSSRRPTPTGTGTAIARWSLYVLYVPFFRLLVLKQPRSRSARRATRSPSSSKSAASSSPSSAPSPSTTSCTSKKISSSPTYAFPSRLPHHSLTARSQHYTFCTGPPSPLRPPTNPLAADDFIVNKYRGKSGPMFNFDVHDDVRLVADATVEKDEVRPSLSLSSSLADETVVARWQSRREELVQSVETCVSFPRVCGVGLMEKDRYLPGVEVGGL